MTLDALDLAVIGRAIEEGQRQIKLLRRMAPSHGSFRDQLQAHRDRDLAERVIAELEAAGYEIRRAP